MKFTAQLGQKYLGRIDGSYLACAADETVRRNAASGGAVSALLLHLMETGRVDGAVVTETTCDGRIGCRVRLARTRGEVLAAQASKYFDVPLVGEAVRLIRGFTGRVAVVGLPCHATALRALARRDDRLASRIECIVTLFCNHSCRRYLLDKVLQAHGIEQSQVAEFHFRRGHWRGRMGGRLRDGTEFSFPFRDFSYYHNLHMFCLPRCLHCHDHTGYDADYAAGDAWLREMKAEPVKHSIILARHEQAGRVLAEMFEQGKLTGRPIDAATVFRSQKRSLIYHYNVTARSRAGRRFGLRIADTVHAPVRWNDALAAWIIMLNHRWSHSPRARDWIFRIPRPLLVGYFLFLKFLQNF